MSGQKMILIDLAEAQTELQMIAKRYCVSKESRGHGVVMWSDNLIEVNKAIELLRNLPERHATSEWILCSDWLPDSDEEVIVSATEEYGDTANKYTTVAWHYNGIWICDNERLMAKVEAWMPLPKPYERKPEWEDRI